jgi:hypothetical protein
MAQADLDAVEAKRAAAAERFGQWCEARDLEPDDPKAKRQYEIWLDAENERFTV